MSAARVTQFCTLAAFTAAAAFPAPLAAQVITAPSPRQAVETIQLAFGHECDDRFLLRNDGGQTVTVEYSVAGTPQRSSVTLKAREAVELSSVSDSALELWVNGKLVASEHKRNRSCAPEQGVPGVPGVTVRPIDPGDRVQVVQPAQPVYAYPPQVVYFGAPYRPYYYGASLSIVLPVFSHFGGHGRVVYVGRPRGRR